MYTLTNAITSYFLLASFAFITAFLLVTALMIRYTKFIKEHPWMFLIELLVIGVLSAIPLLILAKTRNVKMSTLIVYVLILVVQLVIFWTLTELSGYNMLILKNHKESM
jgi:lysylphosphatidylglycerol synthetase-like protein (DUF2156 family)